MLEVAVVVEQEEIPWSTWWGGAGGAVFDPSKTVSNTGGPGSNGAYPISIGAGGQGGNGSPDINKTWVMESDTTFTTDLHLQI